MIADHSTVRQQDLDQDVPTGKDAAPTLKQNTHVTFSIVTDKPLFIALDKITDLHLTLSHPGGHSKYHGCYLAGELQQCCYNRQHES
jgi:hypothetical protein